MPPRICLVTPGYLASTPRVVREADALSGAGFDVRVVFTEGPIEELRAFDRDLLHSRRWRAEAFGWSGIRTGERRANRLTGIRHRIAGRLSPEILDDVPGVAERGEGRTYPELARLAARQAAELFIGHYPEGLAAAAYAARRHGAACGYDIEDLHADILPDVPEWRRPRKRIVTLERRYVPFCSHLTAASQPMADAFAERYQTKVPVVVHNCHPWAERAAMDGRVQDRTGAALSLFWFSQTIGLDRGLQDAITAAGMIEAPVHLHLRGTVDRDVRATLETLAVASGMEHRLHFHPVCAPDALLSRAAEHDVGLALEPATGLNRQLTVSNKLFLYLTAGLATIATDVPGQRAIAETAPDAVALYRPGDVAALARLFSTWSADQQRLLAAKTAALDAARRRWNAEAEGQRLVHAVSQRVGRPAGVPAAVQA